MDELRATQLDLDARRWFTAKDDSITTARAEYESLVNSKDESVEQTAEALALAVSSGWAEVG